LAINHGLHGFNGAIDDAEKLDALFAKLDFSAHDAGDIEQVVHQTSHVMQLSIGNLDGFGGNFRIDVGLLQNIEGAGDWSQRIAQLVSEDGEELVLALVGNHQLAMLSS